MVSGFVRRRWLSFLPLLLLIIGFTGCGMMSVLADEDAGGKNADAGNAADASDEDAPPEGCGDGMIDGRLGEQCDTNNLGGATCRSLRKGDGMLRCDDHCRFDDSLCSQSNVIGDGGGLGDGGIPRRRDGGPII